MAINHFMNDAVQAPIFWEAYYDLNNERLIMNAFVKPVFLFE